MIRPFDITNNILRNIKKLRFGKPEEEKPQEFPEHDPGDLATIERLKKDVSYFWDRDGKALVYRERYPVSRRYSTIAKRHLKSAKKKRYNDFAHECHALIHHFNTYKEKDSAIAVAMLLPTDEKYSQARKQDSTKK